MKNFNSLLARLGYLSLAVLSVFSVLQATEPSESAVMAKILVKRVLGAKQQPEVTAPTLTPAAVQAEMKDRLICSKQSGVSSVLIGSPSVNQNLTVYGDELVHGALHVVGDITSGPLPSDKQCAGLRYIEGVQSLDPRAQQFKVLFKDKTQASQGAFVTLDFSTTATSHRLGIPDHGPAVVSVQLGDIFCHPQMDGGLIMGRTIQAEENMKNDEFTLSGIIFPSEEVDFRLTPTVRVDGITRDVFFGFVPYDDCSFPVIGHGCEAGKGFYEANWTASGSYPVWHAGVLGYKVISSSVGAVGVVNSVADMDIAPLDVFELFSSDELAELLQALNIYFGSDSTKVREYLLANRHKMSRAFQEMRALR